MSLSYNMTENTWQKMTVSYSQEVKPKDLRAGVMWGQFEGLLLTHTAVCGSVNVVENKASLFLFCCEPDVN